MGVVPSHAGGGAVGHVYPLWSYDSRPRPTSLLPPLENATSDREGDTDTTTGESAHRAHDAGADKPAPGLDPVPVLEGGDGADPGRPAVLRKNNICKRDRCKSAAASLHANVLMQS